jgi:hypothetical protein
MPKRDYTSLLIELRTEIFQELSNRFDGVLFWPSGDGTEIYGVAKRTLQVKVEFTKSVFTPVERIEKKSFGQFFCIRPVLIPHKADPDMRLTAEEAEQEDKYGVIAITARNSEEAEHKMRERGLI